MKEWELKEMKATESEEDIPMEDEWPRDIQTVEEWIHACEEGWLIDYDGHGRMLVQDGEDFIDHGVIYPSIRHTIPPYITHIEWFNK